MLGKHSTDPDALLNFANTGYADQRASYVVKRRGRHTQQLRLKSENAGLTVGIESLCQLRSRQPEEMMRENAS